MRLAYRGWFARAVGVFNAALTAPCKVSILPTMRLCLWTSVGEFEAAGVGSPRAACGFADPGAPGYLAEIVRSADVVVFCSNLTDIRSLKRWLADHEVDHRIVTMGMGSGAERARFKRLEQWTLWPLMPQVFVLGVFVGGAEELYATDFAQGLSR